MITLPCWKASIGGGRSAPGNRSCRCNPRGSFHNFFAGTADRKTLGVCVAAIREASYQEPACVASKILAGFTIDTFLNRLRKINDAWVALKHGDEVSQSVLLDQMKSMLDFYQILKFGAAGPSSK